VAIFWNFIFKRLKIIFFVEFVTENLSLWFSFKAIIFCFEFGSFLGRGKNRASSINIHIGNVNNIKYCNLSRNGEKELMGLSRWCAYKYAKQVPNYLCKKCLQILNIKKWKIGRNLIIIRCKMDNWFLFESLSFWDSSARY